MGRQMGRQDAPLGAPLLCSESWVSPEGPPMIDRGRLDMLVTRTLELESRALHSKPRLGRETSADARSSSVRPRGHLAWLRRYSAR